VRGGKEMAYGSTKIKVFYQDGDLSNYLQGIEQIISNKIKQEKEGYILNVNEQDYIQHLISENEIELLNIMFDDAYADQKEEMIRAELFPRDFHVYSGKSYHKMVVYFHLPVIGYIDLLRYTPSTRILWTLEMTLHNDELVFSKIQFSDDIEETNREFESVINSLRTMQEYVNQDVNQFNKSLQSKVQSAIQARKQELLKRSNLLAGLKVPIKKAESTLQTFAIPTPKLRKKIVVKPVVTEQGYSPEPLLDYDTYKEILQMVHGVGKEFERMPSVYSSKGEEQLRDHFLMFLEPNFEGSATGETFNKVGKTDILLRHENSNVFIAECKFWKGKGVYHTTLDQLLSYLTWRDSKSAVIFFVQNKDFSSVIKTVETETPNHSNYLQFVNKTDETWINYKFHINGDRNREVKLAVMLYHIPDIK
jgi:hypothetical protein